MLCFFTLSFYSFLSFSPPTPCPSTKSGDQIRARKVQFTRAQLSSSKQGLWCWQGRRLFCRRAQAGCLIWSFSYTLSMEKCRKNGSGVDKVKQKGFLKGFLKALGEGAGGFLPAMIWLDKRREATWKRGGNHADLLRSLFSTKKCTNSCWYCWVVSCCFVAGFGAAAVPRLVPDLTVPQHRNKSKKSSPAELYLFSPRCPPGEPLHQHLHLALSFRSWMDFE